MVADREPFVPAGMLSQQPGRIEVPLEAPQRFVTEPFVVADREPLFRGGLLSQQGADIIPLPLEPPARFVVEPFVESGR